MKNFHTAKAQVLHDRHFDTDEEIEGFNFSSHPSYARNSEILPQS